MSPVPWPSALGTLFSLCLVLAIGTVFAGAKEAVIVRDGEGGPVAFASAELRRTLEAQGYAVTETAKAPEQAGAVRIALAIAPDAGLKPQGYTVRHDGPSAWRVTGADAAGAMYGGLHLAEAIRLEKGLDNVAEADGSPAILRRGIKFNIPLDARTPSYDDTGDAAQKNIIEMWSFTFWREFLDDMARHRYNTLTLWNPHPFPSLLRLEKYPGVTLPDVCGTTLKPEYKARSWREPQHVSPKVLANLKILKRMTVDEKIAFWRRVMRHARDRGIDLYIITWNVLVNSAEGKHGITDRQDNPRTIAYLRECVRETILTYPDLTGIGVTAGEHMRDRDDEFSREKWLWRAYGLGVLDAKREQPGRTVRFIHRVWQSGLGEMMREFGSKYPDPFEIGFKYARARLYSSPKPPFARGLAREARRHKVKCWWNLRNDDIFCFRWGDPDYVRAFLANFPEGLTAGYHMGSDGYVWGREHTSREPETPRQLEIRKHWYSFMLWGRLGYDPGLDRAFFERVLANRVPEADAAVLYDAWQAGSRVVPQVNRFHWRNWDFMWAVEACFDQRKGFHTVTDFIRTPPMEGSGIVGVPDYVKAALAKQKVEGITPRDVAVRLQGWADAASKGVAAIRQQAKPGKELRHILGDIEAMSFLGRYYAAKILSAVELEAFRQSKDAARRDKAVAHLTDAADHWQAYAHVASRLYRPQLLARTRVLDWQALLKDVRRDIEIARRLGR